MSQDQGQILIATESFTPSIARNLEAQGFALRLNPYHRRLKAEDYPICLTGIDYCLAGLEPYSREVFDLFPNLRVISRIGIGLDSIDLAAARAHGVAVYNTPEAPSKSVAELTLAFILSLLRGTTAMNNDFHAGRWNPYLGRELAEQTVGILGFGRIGTMVAQRLVPFETRVLACDPVWNEKKAAEFNVHRVDFERLLQASDILTLHLPLDPTTRHLIDGKRLDQMKPGGMLVNTSRGGIVDDQALVERLQKGRLQAAALDVFEAEPDTSPYQGVPNLLVSPHIGSHTAQARARMEAGAVKNLLDFIRAKQRGEPVPAGVLL